MGRVYTQCTLHTFATVPVLLLGYIVTRNFEATNILFRSM